jgi:hypothetical protein
MQKLFQLKSTVSSDDTLNPPNFKILKKNLCVHPFAANIVLVMLSVDALNLNSLLLAGGMNQNLTISFSSAKHSEADLIPCSKLQGEFIFSPKYQQIM